MMLCSTRGSVSASICCAIISMVSAWLWGKPVLIADSPWSFSAPFLRNRSPNRVSPAPQTIVTWMLQGQSINLVWWILTHLLGLTPPGAKDATRQFTQSRRLCRGKVRITSLSSPTSRNAHKPWQAWRAQAEVEVFYQKEEPSISAPLSHPRQGPGGGLEGHVKTASWQYQHILGGEGGRRGSKNGSLRRCTALFWPIVVSVSSLIFNTCILTGSQPAGTWVGSCPGDGTCSHTSCSLQAAPKAWMELGILAFFFNQ